MSPTQIGINSCQTKLAVQAAFNKDRSQMTMLLAQQLNLPEATVIRSLPDNLSVELPRSAWEKIIRSFEGFGKVHVIASNGAVTLESVGHFGNFSHTGIFFNVLTPTLDMHIRPAEIDAIFAVRKPSHTNSVETFSFQFFDTHGNSAFKVFLSFGQSTPSSKLKKQFEDLILNILNLEVNI